MLMAVSVQRMAMANMGTKNLFPANAGNSSIIRAIGAAHERDMLVVLLSGGDCKDVSSLIRPEDVEIYVNSSSAPRIIEMQTMIVHCLCKPIDHSLFGIYA